MRTTRKLNFSDTFRLARIIKAARITAGELAELIEEISEAKKNAAAAQTDNDDIAAAQTDNNIAVAQTDNNNIAVAQTDNNDIAAAQTDNNDIAAAQTEAGLAMVEYIINKAPEAENQIYSFLASISGKTIGDIVAAEIPEIMELIKDIFEQNADIKDFFISGLRSAAVMPST